MGNGAEAIPTPRHRPPRPRRRMPNAMPCSRKGRIAVGMAVLLGASPRSRPAAGRSCQRRPLG